MSHCQYKFLTENDSPLPIFNFAPHWFSVRIDQASLQAHPVFDQLLLAGLNGEHASSTIFQEQKKWYSVNVIAELRDIRLLAKKLINAFYKHHSKLVFKGLR